MHIVVAMKQILDPEIPARDFKVDRDKREAVRGGANLVANIFCENALETALQFREQHGGTITALTAGPPTVEDMLRKAMALKADHAALVDAPASGPPDPLRVAKILSAAIRKLDNPDLVLVGRESGDWGTGQTGGLLAEELEIPLVSFVDRIEPAATAGYVRLRRQTELGREWYEVKTPVVLTVTNDDKNVPRIPKTKDVMLSFRKPITKWSLADLGLEEGTLAGGQAYHEVIDLALPERKAECEFVQGDSLEERVEAFARKIAEVIGAA